MGTINRVGQQAISFVMQDDQGNTVCLDDFKGTWLLMVFHRHLA